MEFKFDLAGNDRKKLVSAIGEILDAAPTYKGAPSFAYEINNLIIVKNGTLCFDDNSSTKLIKDVIEGLTERGFTLTTSERVIIEVPKEGFTETSIANLQNLICCKALLIKKAIGTEDLAIEQTNDTISFPWFSFNSTSDEVKAYTHFISALCTMAKSQQRINAASKDVDNEKYAFRCFLLRLGFIGEDFKTERKILLRSLSGNAAFKSAKGDSNNE